MIRICYAAKSRTFNREPVVNRKRVRIGNYTHFSGGPIAGSSSCGIRGRVHNRGREDLLAGNFRDQFACLTRRNEQRPARVIRRDFLRAGKLHDDVRQ